MNYSLQARTETGRELIAVAERHAEDFWPKMPEYDREGSFPQEHLEALKDSGLAYSPAPASVGGLGLTSVHDMMVASSRVARGDPSVMLGVNMHLMVLTSLARQRRIALNREDGERAAALEMLLGGLVGQRALVAAAVSEPDQQLVRQRTFARKTDAGWVANGRKIICSGAPAATHFSVSLGYVDDSGTERYAYAVVPRDLPGITVHDDWDALGMRGSASTSVSFTDVALPTRPGKGAPAGMITAEWIEQMLVSGPAHAASAVGIAERAQELAIEAATTRARRRQIDVSATTRHLAAENSIDLAAALAVFGRSLESIDRYYDDHPLGIGTTAEANEVFAEAQRAKTFVNQAAVRIVDRAMTMTGGGAYLNGNPLARLYRDARAGAFMHPLGANIAYEYIGAVTLGLEPAVF